MMFFPQNMKNPVACFAVDSCEGARGQAGKSARQSSKEVGGGWRRGTGGEPLSCTSHAHVTYA
jgi:hypothetical protein